jgi:hypothetical protein
MYLPPLTIHPVSNAFPGHTYPLSFTSIAFECASQTRQMRRMDKTSVNWER